MVPVGKKRRRSAVENPALGLYSMIEYKFYKGLSPERQQLIADAEARNMELDEEESAPLRFRLLGKLMSAEDKRRVLKEIDMLGSMSPDQSAKRREHILTILDIPFGMFVNPFAQRDVRDVMARLTADMDAAVVGHVAAKRHIVRLVAQWMSGPMTSGLVMGLQGPMGVGKTTLVEQGISKALGIPYSLLSLGGAADSSTLQGHGYTYEGSVPGRIARAVTDAKCMNPILFFDELDKVSNTARGEEVINCLIHLTDSSQHHRFRDKYLGDYDLDMSRAVMIFSFNDRNEVSPVLLDRMTVVEAGGYGASERKQILRKHMIPEAVKKYNIDAALAATLMTDTFVDRIVSVCPSEQGVRTLKRMLHDVCAEANVLAIMGTPADGVSLIDKVIPKNTRNPSLDLMYI
jgi:ATP-dependent Lon protease